MRYSLSKLRDVDIVSNTGTIIDYPELNEKQSACVINRLLHIINNKNEPNVAAALSSYLSVSEVGRTIYHTFPEIIVRQLLDTYKVRIIDHLLLSDD